MHGATIYSICSQCDICTGEFAIRGKKTFCRQQGTGRENILNIVGYDDFGDRVYIRMELAEFSMCSFLKTPEYKEV